MTCWGDIYTERDHLGGAVIRCFECGIVLCSEDPEEPAAGPLKCPECEEQGNKAFSVPTGQIKIISGGQTGADIAGLVAARRLGLPTGGFAPKGWRTEKGPQPILAEYGLVEADSAEYPVRTRLNARHSDATIIFAHLPLTGGSKQTWDFVHTLVKRPVIALDPWKEKTPQKTMDFLLDYRPAVLNVAGSRESKAPGIARQVVSIMEWVLRQYAKSPK